MALFNKKTAPKTQAVKASKAASAPAPKTAKTKAASRVGVPASYARVLLRPSITEKSLRATEKSIYVFLVDPRTTKKEVMKAVKEVYKVTAVKVNIVRVAPRATVSRARRRKGVSSGYKKAFVYLKKGEKIELT